MTHRVSDSEEEIFSSSMPDVKEGSSLLRAGEAPEKVSGKAWGRVRKFMCCQEDYPKGVFFIIGNEFCERFSFYGMRAVLVLYLTQRLLFSPGSATALYHGFTMVCYFTPLLGAILADGFLGKYRTILYLSLVYALGNIVMASTALPPVERAGPIVGLLLIGFGTGGIKPCVSAFGGDQFGADQGPMLEQFFSVFYFAINAGSLLSTLLTPVFREDVSCFGGNCYALSFGVPAVLMITSLILFVCGRNLYKRYPPMGNIIGKTFMCIGYAIKKKCRKGIEQKDHWLDYAEDKYEPKFIEDVKCAIRVLVLFIPLPLFWALYDQQGSRWTLQATKMDGSLGALGHIKPDQMQAINPILIILMIPLFESVIYPLLDKCKIPNRPIQRMCAGMLLAAGSFVLSGFLQISVDQSLGHNMVAGQSGLRIINAAPCSINIKLLQKEIHNRTVIPPLPVSHDTDQLFVNSGNYTATFTVSEKECAFLKQSVKTRLKMSLANQKAYYVVVGRHGNQLVSKQFQYDLEKPKKGGAKVSIVNTLATTTDVNVTLRTSNNKTQHHFSMTTFEASPSQEVETGVYRVYVTFNRTSEMLLANTLTTRNGASYVVIIQNNVSLPEGKGVQMVDYVAVAPNSVSMLLQIPQYVIITAGEILFSITGLSFAYSQAPASMKSVLQAFWLMTVAFGNLIVVIVAEGHWIKQQSVEFFVFAALMAFDTVIFGIMGALYKYRKHDREYEVPDDGTELTANDELQSEPKVENTTINAHDKQS